MRIDWLQRLPDTVSICRTVTPGLTGRNPRQLPRIMTTSHPKASDAPLPPSARSLRLPAAGWYGRGRYPPMQSPVLSREEELYWLALKLVPGLGSRTSGKLLDRFRTPQAIF